MKFNQDRRRKFIEILADTGNISLSAEASGISRRTAYDIREKDEEFRRAWDDAIERAMDNLEHAARKRAMDGVDEPVVSMGKLVKGEDGKPLIVKRYSDSLAALLLRGHRPERYRDRANVKIEGNLDVQVTGAREFIEAELDKIAERIGTKDDH